MDQARCDAAVLADVFALVHWLVGEFAVVVHHKSTCGGVLGRSDARLVGLSRARQCAANAPEKAMPSGQVHDDCQEHTNSGVPKSHPTAVAITSCLAQLINKN